VAVGRETHVELERVHAEGDGLIERLDGVLGRVRGVAAVPDDRARVEREERVHRRNDARGGASVKTRRPARPAGARGA
jgi:hypothetical protein